MACSIALSTLLTNADTGGSWSQLSGPSAISVSNGMFNTDGVAIGTYIFQYCILACGDTFCSQVTVNVEQGADDVTIDLCLTGTYNILTLINNVIGSTYVNGTSFEITYNTGSPTSTSIVLTSPFTIDASTLLPNTYVLKVKKILDVNGAPLWNQCPCEFIVTINAQGCTPLTLTAVNNCTLGISGLCNPNTAILEKQINGVWTTVQTVTVPSQYTLTPGSGGVYRLRHTTGSCTEYSQEVTINCPCSNCDYILTFSTAPQATDGSGGMVGAVYVLINGVATLVPLPNYPYAPNSTLLQQDLQNYENNTNSGGVVNVVTSDNCVSKLMVHDTCNDYSHIEGPSGVCGGSYDLNCFDYVAGFLTTSGCGGNLTSYYTMDIYPQLQSGTTCSILINKRRVDAQINYITRLRKVGVATAIVANVNSLPVHMTTHYKYDAHVDNGGAGNGVYYTESIKIFGSANTVESCTEVTVTECNCTDCTPLSIQFNSCGNVTVTSCPNPGNFILRVEGSPTQSPFNPQGWQDFQPGTWSTPFTFNLFAPTPGFYYRARLYKAGPCPNVLSNVIYFNCSCQCTVTLSLNATTCMLSWSTTCTNYVLQLERFAITSWQVVSNASNPYQVVNDGEYRVRASRAGCTDIVSNIVTTNCACSSPILTVTGAASFQYDCNNIGYYYADVYPSATAITITSSHPVTWSFNRLTPAPTNINIVSSTSTSFTFIPTNISYTCPYTYDNGCYTIDSGDWGYEFIATRSCGDFEKIVIEAYCV